MIPDKISKTDFFQQMFLQRYMMPRMHVVTGGLTDEEKKMYDAASDSFVTMMEKDQLNKLFEKYNAKYKETANRGAIDVVLTEYQSFLAGFNTALFMLGIMTEEMERQKIIGKLQEMSKNG